MSHDSTLTPLEIEIQNLAVSNDCGAELTSVLVIGAGAMGAGIAGVCAQAGMRVTLTDVGAEELKRARQRLSAMPGAVDGNAWLDAITWSTDGSAAAEVDLVIEAVFEDVDLKRGILAEVSAQVTPGALIATNTSTLPIGELAEVVRDPQRFCGVHFFSPVHRMRLVELIPGVLTSPVTVRRAEGLVHRLDKIPVVAGDVRGFFASRVFATYVEEGIRMLAEGHPADVIERAGVEAGFHAPPLAMSDAVAISLSLSTKRAAREAAVAASERWEYSPAMAGMETMVGLDRPGRAAGRGFYDYPVGEPKRLWPGLVEHFPPASPALESNDLVDRLLFAMVAESLRCLDEGVIATAAEANVASVLGIGFPAELGGAIRFAHGYPGGYEGFAARARELAGAYGDRFAPPG